MRRHIEIDHLRTSDPTTVQILAEDVIRLPFAQIAPGTLADLMALSEIPELPRPLRRGLQAFSERIPREIADLPDGAALAEFIRDYGEIDPARVPASLRRTVATEGAREDREPVGRARVAELVARWEEVPPAVVNLPTTPTKKAVVLPVASGEEEAPARRASTPRSAPQREPKPVVPEDVERRAVLRRALAERLLGYGENGLAEAVLLAGVLHRAKEEHQDTSARDVLEVLKEMKATGQVRYSAGRWRIVSRW